MASLFYYFNVNLFKNWIRTYHPGFLASGIWFLAGFDLILIILFYTQIGKLYFPNDDPQNSILAVFGTFSLSLLARVFGGVYFGRLGDIHGRRTIVLSCLILLIITTAFSAFLPSDYTFKSNVTILALIFVLTRVIMGFLVGGLWPTAAVLAMENIYWNRNKANQNTEAQNNESKTVLEEDKDYSLREFKNKSGELKNQYESNNLTFREETKKLTRESSLIQVGYFLGYLASFFYINYALKGGEIFPFFNSYYYYSEGWRSMSLIAVIIGLILYLFSLRYFKESHVWQKKWKDEWDIWKMQWDNKFPPKWDKWQKELKKTLLGDEEQIEGPGITTLLGNSKNRRILFCFWLILTGLMYMYYSTIVTAPVIFERDDFQNQVQSQTTNMPPVLGALSMFIGYNIVALFLIFTCVAHLWPGFTCYYLWTRNDEGTAKARNKIWKFISKIFYDDWALIVDGLFHLRNGRIYGILSKLIGKPVNDKAIGKLVNDKAIPTGNVDVDVRMMVTLGFMLILLGIIGFILFYFSPKYFSAIIQIIYMIIVIFFANAGWALVQSLLSSRFPAHLRSLGSSLAYNGGLVIAFASPFLILELYLHEQTYKWIIFLAMIPGAIAIIIGGLGLMKEESNNKKEEYKESKTPIKFNSNMSENTPHIRQTPWNIRRFAILVLVSFGLFAIYSQNMISGTTTTSRIAPTNSSHPDTSKHSLSGTISNTSASRIAPTNSSHPDTSKHSLSGTIYPPIIPYIRQPVK